MPDLFESADSRSRDRTLIAAPSVQTAPVEHADKATPLAGPEPLLLFERVSKWYGPVIGVNQVTLELHPGITGLVGSNGAGKSTLMRLATGQLKPDLGRVRILGEDAWQPHAKRLVGYSPDIDSFYEDISGRNFLWAMARLCGYTRAEVRRRVDDALELVGMRGRADRKLRGYSKGMRQRIKVGYAAP